MIITSKIRYHASSEISLFLSSPSVRSSQLSYLTLEFRDWRKRKKERKEKKEPVRNCALSFGIGGMASRGVLVLRVLVLLQNGRDDRRRKTIKRELTRLAKQLTVVKSTGSLVRSFIRHCITNEISACVSDGCPLRCR